MDTALTPIVEAEVVPTRARKISRPYASHPVAAAAFDRLEEVLGGREKLVEALMHAEVEEDPDLAYVIGLIADPREDARRLSTVCAKGAVTIGELTEAYKRGTFARTLVETVQRVADATPAIVDDLLARAVVHLVDCPVCYGKGAIPGVDESGQPVERLCTRCDATGRVACDPEFKRQEFVLTKLAGVAVEDRKAPMVAIDQRQQVAVTVGSTPEAYAKLLHAADQLLYGRRALRTSTDTRPPEPVYPPVAGGSPAHDPTD